MVKNQSNSDFRKIKKILEFVWFNEYSSFYRDKYTKAGINLIKDVNSLEDFKKLPYLTREELASSDPFNRFYLPLSKYKAFSISSGSTKGERVIMFRASYSPGFLKKQTKKALELGVRSCMFFNSPTAFGQMEIVPEVNDKNIRRYLGDIYKMDLTAKLMSKLKVDAMSIVPSYLNLLIPLLEDDLKKNIKYILMGGEYCSQARLNYFEKKFPNAYIKRKLASTEAGGIGNRCRYLNHQSPQIFHPLPNLYYEYIDPGNSSEMVLTHLISKGFPLIRYKTGDMVKKIDEKCPCGEEKIKVFGKLEHDVIKIDTLFIYPEEIDDVVVSLENYLDISNWKLHIFGNKLQFQFILKKNLQLTKKIKEAVMKNLKENLCFSDQYNLEVEFLDSIEFLPPKNRNIVYHE